MWGHKIVAGSPRRATGSEEGFFPRNLRRECGWMMPWFQTSGLQNGEEAFLLFYVTEVMVIFHGSLRKWIQAAVASDSVTPWTVARQAPVPVISQARILKWVTPPFSKGSSWPRGRSLALQVDSLPSEPPGNSSSFLFFRGTNGDFKRCYSKSHHTLVEPKFKIRYIWLQSSWSLSLFSSFLFF